MSGVTVHLSGHATVELYHAGDHPTYHRMEFVSPTQNARVPFILTLTELRALYVGLGTYVEQQVGTVSDG